MTMSIPSANRAPHPSSLADVLDLILDKGIVIDAYVRVSVVGIELLTLDARIVIASVDTYLRFAEAVNRLDIQPQEQPIGLPGMIGELQESGAQHKTRGAVSGISQGAKQVASSLRGGGEDEDEDEQPRRRPRKAAKKAAPARRSRSRSNSEG